MTRCALPAETGPIRPPSEARSLLVRISRNCPWNRCLFCPVYKSDRFSLRSAAEVRDEIAFLAGLRDRLDRLLETASIQAVASNLDRLFDEGEIDDARRLLHWRYHGDFSVFLQDADPLLRRRGELTELLALLKNRFPEIRRITAYARATTIRRFSPVELAAMKKAGLDRIHTGLESGSARVLALVRKGVTREDVIAAGRALADAGIELSLYVMPGLGGKALSGEHVSETVDAVNRSRCSYLRLRSLALYPGVPLHKEYREGRFSIVSEDGMVDEIAGLIEGISTPLALYSDHTLNLLMELNGELPGRRPALLAAIARYRALPDELRFKFVIARRLGLLFELGEFLAFPPAPVVNELYGEIIGLSEIAREDRFLELRSRNI